MNRLPIRSYNWLIAVVFPLVLFALANATAGLTTEQIEPDPSAGLSVKYRIDGVLDAITDAAGVGLAEQAISRLKVLAELDIAERRVPQDGSFRVSAQGREIDLRVSIIPGVHGEDAVIRILDKGVHSLAMGQLLQRTGFEPLLANFNDAESYDQWIFGLTLPAPTPSTQR